jgi:hypothetical protein
MEALLPEEEEGTQQIGGLDLASPSWGAALEAGGQERRQGRFIVRRRPAGGANGGGAGEGMGWVRAGDRGDRAGRLRGRMEEQRGDRGEETLV